MAGDTVLAQHGRDRLLIRNLRMRAAALALRHHDVAAGGIGVGDLDRRAAQGGIQRCGNIVICAFLSGAPINHFPILRIDDQHLAVARKPQRFTDQLQFIGQYRQAGTVGLRLFGDRIGCVLEVRIYGQKLDVLSLIARTQRIQGFGRGARGGAAIAGGQQHHGLHIRQIVEFVRLAVLVVEAEVIDDIAWT